jgi:hypothetical protein
MKYIKEIFVVVAVLFVVAIFFIDATETREISIKDKKFDNWMFTLINEAKTDSSFKRIPLDSKSEQRWFMEITYSAWNQEISSDKYVTIGIAKFPGYEKSFKFIAKRLP